MRWKDDAGELFLEVAAEGFLGGFSLRDSFIGFHQCGLIRGEHSGIQGAECRHLGDVACLRHGLRFRGVIVLLHEFRRKKKEGGKERNMRAVCETTCSCYLHRGREEAEDCEMANHREKW